MELVQVKSEILSIIIAKVGQIAKEGNGGITRVAVEAVLEMLLYIRAGVARRDRHCEIIVDR